MFYSHWYIATTSSTYFRYHDVQYLHILTNHYICIIEIRIYYNLLDFDKYVNIKKIKRFHFEIFFLQIYKCNKYKKNDSIMKFEIAILYYIFIDLISL